MVKLLGGLKGLEQGLKQKGVRRVGKRVLFAHHGWFATMVGKKNICPPYDERSNEVSGALDAGMAL